MGNKMLRFEIDLQFASDYLASAVRKNLSWRWILKVEYCVLSASENLFDTLPPMQRTLNSSSYSNKRFQVFCATREDEKELKLGEIINFFVAIKRGFTKLEKQCKKVSRQCDRQEDSVGHKKFIKFTKIPFYWTLISCCVAIKWRIFEAERSLSDDNEYLKKLLCHNLRIFPYWDPIHFHPGHSKRFNNDS